MVDVERILDILPRPRDPPHMVFVSGKGGVGKTTVSILLAMLLSRKGRVLVESLDQAKHLKEYLGLESENKRIMVDGRFYAVQFDTSSEVKRLGKEYMGLVQRVIPGLKVINAENVLDMVKNAPGLEEEVYLREISKLYRDRGFDYIVVDTPPTGLTLRILNLPRLYKFWIERLLHLRTRIASLRYVIARSIGREAEIDDPVLEKLKEMLERYSRLEEMLRSPDSTTFVLVATPEPLPVYEVLKTVEFLENLGARPRIIVANRILPGDVADKLGIREVQERSLERLREISCGRGCMVVEIPMVETVPSSLEGVKNLVAKIRVKMLL